MKRSNFSIIACCAILLISCSPSTTQITPTSKPAALLTPYHTATISPASPGPTIAITIPVTPAPTATPFLHTITDKDTMLGIAYQYGISLEDLQAANPGVDPHYLSVGKQLVIPINGVIPETVPTPTPEPLNYLQPACYPTGDGGVWCIVAVRNDLNTDIENICVWIGVFSQQGESVDSIVACAPLDLLHPGDTIPVMAYFKPPVPEKFEAQAELVSGLAVASDDSRYLDVQARVEKTEISPDGKTGRVSGEVQVLNITAESNQFWVLAVAYDAADRIIGARKWESTGETNFNLTVYSLGGQIDHIEILVEARP